MDAEVTTPADHAASDDGALERLLAAVFRTYHYDFRSYALASLRRRLAAALSHFGAATLGALEARVVQDPAAFTELLRYLTVQVSDLFRDPTYFRAIRERVVPYLDTYPSLKVWVAGCATGEEAYSLAILLDEAGLLDRTLIYATDIHPESLRRASEGIYDLDRFPRFSANYLAAGGTRSLADYYTAQYSSALFERRLRSAILFSDHSLATDSAFAEVQLVSCRNVLIYFDRALQDRALGVLRDALCRRGFLGLGAKESLRFSSHAPAFREVVAEERIYQRL
ncbi:MAG TPA: CheR family methyltransferase [Polyangia bacterium]|jgi:chemotaxis protein methyltransferase CheR|nr:CheR family methyltransferase [Polyangia bacterium]